MEPLCHDIWNNMRRYYVLTFRVAFSLQLIKANMCGIAHIVIIIFLLLFFGDFCYRYHGRDAVKRGLLHGFNIYTIIVRYNCQEEPFDLLTVMMNMIYEFVFELLNWMHLSHLEWLLVHGWHHVTHKNVYRSISHTYTQAFRTFHTAIKDLSIVKQTK